MMFKKFENADQYDAWVDSFEELADCQMIPVMIDDGWKIAMDMFIECKSWKTAVRRFAKTFVNVSENVDGWIECMEECCKGGCFKDMDADLVNLGQVKQFGTYSWGVEETSEGLWYIYLNISGIYADRERTIA